MWLFLSRRLRQWVLLALLLPFVGRLLERVGGGVAARNPRAGSAIVSAGRTAQQVGGRGRRSSRRRF